MTGKGTPNLPAGIDRQTKLAIDKIAETSDIGAGLRGNPEDRYIRVGDLIDMGLAKRLGRNAQRLVAGANLISTNAPNTDIPPKPEHFETAGGIGIIFLTWDNPRQFYSNHSFTEIWRSETDDLGAAILVGQSAISFMFEDTNVDFTKTYYYWIRFVSASDINGPWNDAAGTAGHCQQDPGELLSLLQDQITESHLYSDLNDRINLIDADGTGLLDRVDDLETVFGDTATAAASAAAAIAAKVAAEIAAGNADAAATSASTSQSVATSAATAAATSATSAAGYSSSAGSAAAAASTSATNAATSAGSASTSATSASSSATSAAGSASTAGTSATAAATSATAAAGSATAAAGSASSASTSATDAGNSATAAISAKVSAESARDTAASHASAASTSASSASTSASAASSSASASSSSASTASTAAADALTYKNSAATSATDAAGYAAASAVDYTAINARLNNAGGTGVTVEQKLTATASDTAGNSGQYTLKIDNNGVITGFGLSSETVNGQTSSYFLVNADTFGIVNTGASKVITSLTRSGTTATASCTAHGYTVGSKVAISSVYDSGWNGVVTVASASTNSFTFTVPNTLTTPANSYVRANGRPLSSLTRSSTTATATFLNTPHNVQVGQTLDISSASQSEWNGQWVVTAITSTTATFTVPGTHTTPATSAIKVAPQTTPFVVSGGKVVMDGAFIKDATIGNAAIDTLSVTKLTGDTANFVKLNVGTLVVDDIQGDISGIYSSGTITTAFNFGGAAGTYGGGGNQLSVATINVPARSNSLPYGTQFYVQGVATKATAGSANIVADFFESNASPSTISTLSSPSDMVVSANYFQRVIMYANGATPSNPTNWDSVAVGDALTLYQNSSNLMEGIVTEIVNVNAAAGPSNFVWGKVFVLSEIIKVGSVPSNASGCTLTRRSSSGRLYKKIGITLSTSLYTSTTNEVIRYNMSYYDTGSRATTSRNIVCTIGHYGSGDCTNSAIDFAVFAGR